MSKAHPQPPTYQQATATVMQPATVYVQGQQAANQPIIIQQAAKLFVPYPSNLGRQPTALTCPCCHSYVMTDTSSVEGTGCCLAFTVGTVLSCTGLGLILCCLVCCSDATHDISHRCPKCNSTLGVNKRL